ncbi:MAG: hypothetical protein PWP65_1270 [Clostridia bacterium]|nr:hypothetical protein [Clostridia bacterium]
MTWKGWRLHFVFIGLILTLLLLFGGEGLYRRYFVIEPLKQSLKSEQGVQAVDVQEMPQGYRLLVKMGPVENIQSAYQEIETRAEKALGRRVLEVVLIDKRSPALANAWQQAQFAIYEAVARGNFTEMAARVDELARREEIEHYALNIDAHNIYLQFHQGDNYLYAVIPRIESSGNILAAGGGVNPGA